MKRSDLKPEDAVSLGHYESLFKGMQLETRRREAEYNKFCGETIMVDYTTGYVKTFYQVSFTADKILKSKTKFKKEARFCGVKAKS